MEQVRFEKSNGVALVTLNNPGAKNAYTVQMSGELSECMEDCDRDDAIRSIVLTGAGDHFCVGMDFNSIAAIDPKDGRHGAGDMKRTYPFQIRKPVICAINGTAGGFGAAYPLACDIRIVDEAATIGFTFVRNGLLPEMGATWFLPRLVGMERAAELLLTGRKIDGRKAEQIGLALAALPKAHVLPAAMELAEDIARNTAPVPGAVVKSLLWKRFVSGADPLQIIEEDRDNFIRAAGLPDCREGVGAFLKKRQPIWGDSVSALWPEFDPVSGD